MVSEIDIKNAQILIVDDQKANLQLLDYLLSRAGYTKITLLSDSRQVAEMYRNERYDLIMLDLNMPFMDGFEVIEALKPVEAMKELPVLVLTADPNHKKRALDAGAKDFLSKPLETTEVLARVRTLLEVRLLQKKLKTLGAEGAAYGAATAAAEMPVRRATTRASPQGVSHEFNNLLGIVIGNLDMMADLLPADHKLRGHYEAALEAALRLAGGARNEASGAM